MSDAPRSNEDQPEPPRLKFLRRLVIALTLTMIVGLITIVTLIVMTFMRTGERSPVVQDTIALPAGQTATAFTKGTDWNAVVTRDETGTERILILDPETGDIRQTIEIKPSP